MKKFALTNILLLSAVCVMAACSNKYSKGSSSYYPPNYVVDYGYPVYGALDSGSLSNRGYRRYGGEGIVYNMGDDRADYLIFEN